MSTFIKKDDFLKRINEDRLNQLTGNEDSMLDEVEIDAVAMIQEYLAGYFDMDAEFAKTEDDRNRALVRWTLNLAMYYLYQRTPDKFMPDDVNKDYDDTLKTLEKIINSKVPTNLERKKYDSNGDGDPDRSRTRMRMGSGTPRSHDPFRSKKFER